MARVRRLTAVARSSIGLFVVSLVARTAAAHQNGEPTQGCTGCHKGGKIPTVSVVADSPTVALGGTFNLTVSVTQTNGPTAGFYLLANGVGSFVIIDPGTKLLGSGVTHAAPRAGIAGNTTFRVAWVAPNAPGGVDFYVWANSANGDGTPQGDGEGIGFFSTAFGCPGKKYYHDYDGDGVGSVSAGFSIACALHQYYSEEVGDCNDNDPTQNPRAAEVCDGKDNDCDGNIDEGLPIQSYCADEDGDGHGVSGQHAAMGCAPPKGYGSCDGDCDDRNSQIYPSAAELCNGRDDDCDGRIDEDARTICGVGWCASYAQGCSSECTPGKPRREECNAFDDDCDGESDNGTNLELCGASGLVCRAGTCIVEPAEGAGVPAGSGAGAPQAEDTRSLAPNVPSSAGAAAAGAASRASPDSSHCAVNSLERRGWLPFDAALLALSLALVRARRFRSKIL